MALYILYSIAKEREKERDLTSMKIWFTLCKGKWNMEHCQCENVIEHKWVERLKLKCQVDNKTCHEEKFKKCHGLIVH